jgi:hypothetical protein
VSAGTRRSGGNSPPPAHAPRASHSELSSSTPPRPADRIAVTTQSPQLISRMTQVSQSMIMIFALLERAFDKSGTLRPTSGTLEQAYDTFSVADTFSGADTFSVADGSHCRVRAGRFCQTIGLASHS